MAQYKYANLLIGLRASEVFKLKTQDIDLERGLLFLRSPLPNGITAYVKVSSFGTSRPVIQFKEL